MTVGAMDLPPEGMLLGGVALAGDPARGTTNTEGLSLLFTSAGITVQGKQPESERLLPWAGLDTATCHDQTELPGGRTASVLVLTSGGQQVRFLLPPETVSPGQAAYLDQAMPAWLARYRGAAAPAPAPAPAAPAPAAPAAAVAAPAAAAATAAAVAAESHRPPAAPAGQAAPAAPVAPAAAPAPPVVAPAPAAEAPPVAPAPAPPVATGPPTAPTPTVDEFAVPPLLGVPPEPAIDPVTGQAVWTDPNAPAADGGKPAKKSRKARKAEAAAAAAAAAATVGVAAADPFAAHAAPAAADPFAAAPAAPAPQPTDLPPTAGEPLSPLPPEGAAPAKKESSRRTLALLIGLLVVVLIVGALLLVNRNSSNNTTATTAAPATTVPGGAADQALAQSINLRQSDLPAGWTVATAGASSAPVPPSAASLTAFATCLGLPSTTVDQLFGTAKQADVAATAASPVFAAPGDPTTEMQSSTNVVSSPSAAAADTAPFANPNFAGCFQTFQNANAAAAKPGSTAQVQTVTLSAPAGVKSYGYLTTFTIPGVGTKIEGDAFIVGGTIETTLVPTTNGTPVPSDAFTSAYNAIVARVAAHATS